jgi:hypothetical protein
MLRDSVASHCLDIMPQLRVPEKVKVIGRVYANFRSIAETTMRANTIDSVAIVEDFARGFTQAYPSFDFIDVRFENGVAEKIFGMILALFLGPRG